MELEGLQRKHEKIRLNEMEQIPLETQRVADIACNECVEELLKLYEKSRY